MARSELAAATVICSWEETELSEPENAFRSRGKRGLVDWQGGGTLHLLWFSTEVDTRVWVVSAYSHAFVIEARVLGVPPP